MSSSASQSIKACPAPWTLKCTIYTFMMYVTSKDAKELSENKSFLYSPLEEASQFSSNKPVGGLGMVQVIRYSESPVGPYDELLMIPGEFEYEVEIKDTKGSPKVERKKNLRVARIYVSSKESCWNGRTNWNVPKHLARFEFAELPGNAISIKVFPDDTNTSAKESSAFLSAIYKPIPYLPSFPASTGAAKYLGMDLSIVQPPLPKGETGKNWIPGTDQWCKVLPLEYSSKTSLGWWDFKNNVPGEEEPLLARGDGQAVAEDRVDDGGGRFWPGHGRWRIGMKMEDATVEFGEGEHWH